MASGSVTVTLPPGASPELVERLRSAFPDARLVEAAAVAPVPSPVDLETALGAAVAASGGFGQAMAEWWSRLPGGAGSLVLIGVAMLAAYAIERGARALAARHASGDNGDTAFGARLGRGLGWLAGRLLGLVVFAVAARLVGRAILPAEPELRDLGLGLLGAVLLGRAIVALIDALAAPRAPARRLMGFSDAEAAEVFRTGMRLALFVIALRLGRVVVVDAAGTAPEAHLALAAIALANAAATAAFFVAVSRPVARLMTGAADRGWPAWAARRWHWAFLALVALDLALKVLGILGLLASDATDGAGPAILLAIVATLAVAALAILRREPGIEARGGLVQGAFVLAEGLVIVAGAVLLLLLWGIDPLAPRAESGLVSLLPGLVEAAVVVAVGAALWRAVTAFIAGVPVDVPEAQEAGDGMGGEGSRLHTILPILRGFALALIVVTTALSALSALGMNVGPLIASAGVVGLAIGFGAQKLVSDVISGLFYLYEDAFRLGEYVVTEGGKGTVERISIRSATLRHHNGPIYTIPFSAMGTIQNHSRDYVVMKFSFAVPGDTDLEMVRKLVKKAGQELAADPELEGKLIAPLKSQGAISIQGTSFEIGCKFTARPGTQFVIRRKAYAVLQRALRERGVELFAPSLTLSADRPLPGVASDGRLPSNA